ncbi:MAG: hypothetical protein ABH867_03185 [Patescibacteria group bacterium]|nr:hypothetical protein [Patescibacteria group bacterium]
MPGEAADTGIAQRGPSTDQRIKKQIEQGKGAKETLLKKLGSSLPEKDVSCVQSYFSLLERAAEMNPNQQTEATIGVVTAFAILLQDEKTTETLGGLMADPSFNLARTAFMDAAATQAKNAGARRSIINDAVELSKGEMPGATDWMRKKGINRPAEWDEIGRKGRQL